jgi:hypothetical protein
MAGDPKATRADFDSLVKKLCSFAETLSASEQLAFAQMLGGADLPQADSRNDFPGESWQHLMGMVSNNAGTVK